MPGGGVSLPQERAKRCNLTPRKVVLVQTARLEDVVFVSPLVRAFKESCPQAWLALLVRAEYRDAACCIQQVDEVLTLDSRGTERGVWRLARKLRRDGYDVLISAHRSSRVALLAFLSRIPFRVGFPDGLGRLSYHRVVRSKTKEVCEVVSNMALLQEFGIRSMAVRARLKGPNDQQEFVEEFCRNSQIESARRWVGLCIGSNWPTKRWPAIYFASLAGMLRGRGYLPILFSPPGEFCDPEEIEEALGGRLHRCIGNGLSEAAALLEKCELVVGGDSGLTHMAQALGVPAVIVYGPTDPRAHSFGDGVRVLFAKIKCRPCGRRGRGRCPLGHSDCMRLVSPEQVLDELRGITNLQTPIPVSAERNSRVNRDEPCLPPL